MIYAMSDLHVCYDKYKRMIERINLSLFMGYDGKYASEIEKMMENSDDLTLKMQSITGELAFGGRSNQCIHNEMLQANYYELCATLLNKKGCREKQACLLLQFFRLCSCSDC